jgi:peptidyl-prolyl cis-trans isomerase A (cyclophilin A)
MAPDTFTVDFNTTRGRFTVAVDRSWAPNGADRFHELVESGFYDDVAFFRVLSGFVAQFGISGDPDVAKKWRSAPIDDDPVVQSNSRGTITFATAGPNTRTTQLFINLADNTRLDSMGFSPFARVADGFDVVEALYADYGEGAPNGSGPSQGLIESRGNAYLKEEFPHLDFVTEARITS